MPGGSGGTFPWLARGSYRGMGGYAFGRSWGQEDERLAAVERQLDPVSQAAVDQLGLAAGWNPLYGRRLVSDLQRDGLEQVAGRAHRSCQPGGDAWAGARLGVERMRDQIRHAGASCADLDEALAALADPTRVIMGGPIVTAWGQRTS